MTKKEKKNKIRKTEIELREDISKQNRQHFKDFLPLCTAASESKFRSFMPYVLTRTQDFLDMANNDKKGLIILFSKLKKELRPGGYKTIVGCSRTFCRELNDGVTPENFRLLPKLTKQDKATMKRINDPEYKSLTWDDVKKIADSTTSIQLKAMLSLMMEAGLRPAELVNLNYGDVRRDGKFLILDIWHTKNGEPRHPVLYRSVPAVNRWLENHPIKTKKAPLWIMEQKGASSLYRSGKTDLRYSYHAIKQTVRRMAKKAGYEKGLSIYLMRHSAVNQAKEAGMGVDVGSEFFGHSLSHFVETYGKLTEEQKVKRLKGFYGEETKKEKKPQTRICPICNTVNEPGRETCEKCRSPLSLEVALTQENRKDQQIAEMKEQVSQLLAFQARVEGKVAALREEQARRAGK